MIARTYFGPFSSDKAHRPALLTTFLEAGVPCSLLNDPKAGNGWGGFWITFDNESDETAFRTQAIEAGLLTEVSE